MKLGIKVSLQSYSLSDINQVHPQAAEVWFDISRTQEYSGLFRKLSILRVETGLHFWGSLADGTLVNISYPDKELNKASMNLIKKAIDIAAQNHFVYVNIHPGSQARVKVNFRAMKYLAVDNPTELSGAINRFIDNALMLSEYARSRSVVFTVETVSRLSPLKDWYNPESRLTPINIYDLPIEAIELSARHKIAIANDFVHTATHAPSTEPTAIWEFLKAKTQKLLSQTKLIHLGFLIPPFNGVDNHDMLDNPIFNTNRAVPNRTQVKELLSLYKDKDVWIITEPRANHAKNYLLAQKLLSEV